MATTSLWHIKGRLKDLIDYVENSEKTAAKAPELQDLYNVFTYAFCTSSEIILGVSPYNCAPSNRSTFLSILIL